ncbi:MAG: hypothetical protein J5I98_03355 [Phaeodactylibacter sp.]|nr:hypothetical protein [Phaeodactylibacter sp.]
MNYIQKLQQSRRFFRQLESEAQKFNQYARFVQENTDLFKKSITNVQGTNNELENLKKQARELKRLLDSLLSGGKKRYASSHAERASPHFQGEYGRLKGDVRKYQKMLGRLLDHINFLSDVVKSTYSDEARITLALQAYGSQNESQLKKFGSSFDGADPIVMASLVAAVIKSAIKKLKG